MQDRPRQRRPCPQAVRSRPRGSQRKFGFTSIHVHSPISSLQGRITDLISVNNNLTSIKNKLETELSTAQADLDEATKELHAADERANRALVYTSLLSLSSRLINYPSCYRLMLPVPSNSCTRSRSTR